MNSLFTNNISLDHGTHTYQLLDDPEFRFASVTEFIHEFFRKFDQEKTAKKLISEHPKYIDRTLDDVIKEWRKGAERGTIVHNELELFIKEGIEPKHELANVGARWLKTKQETYKKK